ncbi:hypothetical protein Hanom_Chr14g01327991 [Helianthus anomalus]
MPLGVQTSRVEPELDQARARARLTLFELGLEFELGSFVFSQARARLVCYLLINILNINNRLFRLVSSMSEARARARLLNKLIFRFEVGL